MKEERHIPFSKRNKALPDVFQYDAISTKLKNQVFHIWNKFFNKENFKDSRYSFENHNKVWKGIHDFLAEEEGVKELMAEFYKRRSYKEKVEIYFDRTNESDKVLDVIEFIFRLIPSIESYYNSNFRPPLKFNSASAYDRLNNRFKENGIGFQFESGQIIRIDNSHIHENIIKPTLSLLTKKEFSNANDEFLKAHRHYRNSEYEDCLVECLKSFETTLKLICHYNNWSYNENDTSKPLIKIVLENDLIPAYNESKLHSLRTLLESSLPTTRNKNSSHGQGAKKRKVDQNLAEYMLNMTGTTIKFLIQENKKLAK